MKKTLKMTARIVFHGVPDARTAERIAQAIAECGASIAQASGCAGYALIDIDDSDAPDHDAHVQAHAARGAN